MLRSEWTFKLTCDFRKLIHLFQKISCTAVFFLRFSGYPKIWIKFAEMDNFILFSFLERAQRDFFEFQHHKTTFYEGINHFRRDFYQKFSKILLRSSLVIQNLG